MVTLDSLDLTHISDSELGELLIEAKKAYYTTSKPTMDDHTYDTLEDLLKKRNPYHRIFSKVGNPNFDTGFDKKKHQFILGSQNKASSYTDMVHYFELKKISANTNFLVQPKCDGLSLEIEYKNGQFVDAITRGDGEIGDVISQNAVLMKNFKLNLSPNFTGSIRCEIVVTLDDFKKLNQLAPNTYTNPRNAASGICQRLDSKFNEFCTLVAVDIFSKSNTFTTESDKLTFLQKLGIKVVDSFFCQSYSQIEKVYQDFLQHHRSTYPFEIDGLVIKIDNTDLQHQLGSKNNRPKHQIAYKFPANSSQSRVVAIDWQVGPLGTVTPVAQIDPILVSGATITYVSLANLDQINDLNLNIDDIVEVSRRGDVIPHIEKVVSKVNSHHITPPKYCPNCQTKLIFDNKFLKCPNSFTCPAQTLGQLNLFCKVLDIKGISHKTVQKLHQSGLLNLPGDFYTLQIDDISKLENLGQKSASNIVFQIQAKTKLDLQSVFHAASIPNFSKARIKQLIDAGFNTPDKLLNLSTADLENLPGFKITLAQKIIHGIEIRKKAINSILKNITLINSNVSSKLQGLTFCITGELSVPRSDIEKIINQNGGNFSSQVSSKTSYLITNKISSSAKFSQAKKLNIPIITESQFMDLVKK